MAVFTPGGSIPGAMPPITVEGSKNPTIANVPIPTAATEVSYALPANTKKFYISLRDPSVDLKLAYVLNDSGTTYVTIHRGTWGGEESLTTSVVLYFQATSGSQVAEIVSWT